MTRVVIHGRHADNAVTLPRIVYIRYKKLAGTGSLLARTYLYIFASRYFHFLHYNQLCCCILRSFHKALRLSRLSEPYNPLPTRTISRSSQPNMLLQLGSAIILISSATAMVAPRSVLERTYPSSSANLHTRNPANAIRSTHRHPRRSRLPNRDLHQPRLQRHLLPRPTHVNRNSLRRDERQALSENSASTTNHRRHTLRHHARAHRRLVGMA